MARIPTNVGGATPEMRRQIRQQAEERAAAAAAQRSRTEGGSLGPLGTPQLRQPQGAPGTTPEGPPQVVQPPQRESLSLIHI